MHGQVALLTANLNGEVICNVASDPDVPASPYVGRLARLSSRHALSMAQLQHGPARPRATGTFSTQESSTSRGGSSSRLSGLLRHSLGSIARVLSPSARTTAAESSQGAGEHAECPAAAADGVEVATGLPETRPVRLDDTRTV